MISGVGYGEILLIGMLALMFFGSKELPQLLRHSAQWIAKIRSYSNKIRHELRQITDSLEQESPAKPRSDSTTEQKNALRKKFRRARLELTGEQRQDYGKRILDHLGKDTQFQDARSVMVYMGTDTEVPTKHIVEHCLAQGKRVVVPYCTVTHHELGIAAIESGETDLVPGAYGILEPREDLRDNFFKSDLQLVICPAVAFDLHRGRLGRGKGYYDRFLRELKGRVPIFGIAFSCQISPDPFPFSYSDIPMDVVITEKGPLQWVTE